MSMVVPPDPSENQRPDQMQARAQMDRERIEREFRSTNLLFLVPYVIGLLVLLVVAALVRLVLF
jgi:hypothetical protein